MSGRPILIMAGGTGGHVYPALAVAEALRELLDGFSGTVSSVVIQCIFLSDQSDLPVIPAGNEVARRYAKRMDFTVWFNE